MMGIEFNVWLSTAVLLLTIVVGATVHPLVFALLIFAWPLWAAQVTRATGGTVHIWPFGNDKKAG
jgi:hypothetical protein